MWNYQRYLLIREVLQSHTKSGSSLRSFAVQVKLLQPIKIDIANAEIVKAKPFHNLPGPSKFQLLKGFLPGGLYYKMSLVEVNQEFRRQFGEIFLIPGLFGKRDLVFTFNPCDFEKVFRTEGVQPIRRGLDIVHYHRKTHRPEVFKHAAGLVAEQGERWSHFRSTVNPVMMNPKTIKLYTPRMNKVVDEFIERIRELRDPISNEVPENFEEEINHWALDSMGLVALDTELGMINRRLPNTRAKAVVEGMREFFKLLFDLDMKPSLWKFVPTPKFKKAMQKFDQMTDLSIYYIDAAIGRLEAEKRDTHKNEIEKSILERLLHIDRTVAIVMAMDIILAGVDTTSSALVGCLLALAKNPEKQQKLRFEISNILPCKNSRLTSEQMQNMPYLRACIKEAFRYYPVSTGNFRATGREIVLSGYRIPQNTDIAMPGQLLMRDEKYFDHPNEYRPERWCRNEVTSTNQCPLNRNVPFVFLPFGFGPRICIGTRIVNLQLEVALTKLVRNFEIHFDYDAENMFKTHIINVPSKPLRFKFKDIEY